MVAYLDRCSFTATAGTTADFVVSAATPGFQTPAAAGAVNGTAYAFFAQSADLTQWEIGTYTWNSSTSTMVRTSISANSSGGTSKINFTSAPTVTADALSAELPSLSGANVWSASQTIKRAGGNQVLIDTVSAGDYAAIGYNDNGTQKWATYKDPSHTFHLLDSAAGTDVFSVTSNGGGFALQRPAQFNGKPWFDVTHPTYGADPTGATDSTTAIQNAINAAAARGVTLFGAGSTAGAIVFFPPGIYKVSSTLTISDSAVTLLGSGVGCTLIYSNGVDIKVLYFVDTNLGSKGEIRMGARDMSIAGGSSTSAANFVVHVDWVVSGVFENLNITGGLFALAACGTDCDFNDIYPVPANTTSGGGVFCGGANWFRRGKFDLTAKYGVFLGYYGENSQSANPGAVNETHFELCDFSGTYSNASVDLDDSGGPTGAANQLWTTFMGCVFSGSVKMTTALITMFSACEFGGAISVGAGQAGCFSGCSAKSAIVVSLGSGAAKEFGGCFNLT